MLIHCIHKVPLLPPPDPLSRLPTVNGGDPLPVNATRKMRALFGYSPATDSPNENKDEELCIEEGDVVTVFGRPDDDGYYQVLRQATRNVECFIHKYYALRLKLSLSCGTSDKGPSEIGMTSLQMTLVAAPR